MLLAVGISLIIGTTTGDEAIFTQGPQYYQDNSRPDYIEPNYIPYAVRQQVSQAFESSSSFFIARSRHEDPRTVVYVPLIMNTRASNADNRIELRLYHGANSSRRTADNLNGVFTVQAS